MKVLCILLSVFVCLDLKCLAFLHPASPSTNAATQYHRGPPINRLSPDVALPMRPANGTQAITFDSVSVLGKSYSDMAPRNSNMRLQRWVRRLNTKEDLYWIHKVSSLTSCASSVTIIMAMLNGGLQEFPVWLGPVDATFVLSNIALCLTTIHMVGTYRRDNDSVAKTHLSAGLQALIMSLYATWESPYCASFLDDKLSMQATFCTAILVAAYVDLTIFFDNNIVATMHRKYGLTREGSWQAFIRAVTFDGALLVPTIMNLCFLFFMLSWDLDRQQWHSAMVDGFGVSFLTGNSMEYIYFANVCITLGIGLQSFVGTLSHKRLLSADDATAFVGLVNLAVLGLLGLCVISPFPR